MPATTIFNPAGSNFDSINNAFGQIYSMFGGSGNRISGSGATDPFGTSPQPISGADNSVTAGQRASMNLLGQAAPTAFTMGQNLLGTGLGVTQGGLGVAGGGVGVMGTGLETLQPSIDFYNKILAGDPSTTSAALAPTAANIAQIYSGALNQANQGMPAGGYRAATLAGLPQAQAAQVGNAALGLQPAAAQALAALGGEQAQIGQGIAGVGTTIGGLGTQIGGLGTQLTGQGLSGIQNLAQDLLEKQHINQLDPTVLQQISQALGIAGTLAGGIGGALGAGGAGGIFTGIAKGMG